MDCYIVSEREWDYHSGFNNKSAHVFVNMARAKTFFKKLVEANKELVIRDEYCARIPNMIGCGHSVKITEACLSLDQDP